MAQDQSPVIGVAGMTHLGSVMGAVFKAKGFEVVTYGSVEAINEPGIILQPSVLDPSVLSVCDIVFVTLDTPLDSVGRPQEHVVRDFIRHLKPSVSDSAVIVIMSQVAPGFTSSLPFSSERLFYQVETLRFGDSFERAMNPERLIIGTEGCDNFSHFPAYDTILAAFDCPKFFMSWESAELAKIAINTMLVAQLTATNLLAEACEHTAANWSDIVPVLTSDHRIGTYLAPGLGIGGGHITRDLYVLDKFTSHKLGAFSLSFSEWRRHWLIKTVNNALEEHENAVISILGLAYKAGTNSTVNSPGMELLRHLEEIDIEELEGRVFVHDPQVIIAKSYWLEKPEDCIKNADILVALTAWPEYEHIDTDYIINHMVSGFCVIDPYRWFDGRLLRAHGFRYHTLGESFRIAP